MIKEYLKRKWLWVDKNPRLASCLGWVKGGQVRAAQDTEK